VSTVDLMPGPTDDVAQLWARFKRLHPGGDSTSDWRPMVSLLDDDALAGAATWPISSDELCDDGFCRGLYICHSCPLGDHLGRDECQCPPPTSGVR
jgi:hypothetical protein